MTPPTSAVDDSTDAADGVDPPAPAPHGGAPGPGHGEGDEPGDREDDEPGGDTGPAGLSWGRVLVLSAAVAFLGYAVGVFVSRDTPPETGSVDVGFYRDMVAHHQQALSLATLELADGENSTVRSYARDVLTFQSYEIGVMQNTLDEWGIASAGGTGEAMAWMGMGGSIEQMPGWVSDEEMDRLKSARGAESDSLFLDLMADHHAGGIHMASYAAEHADDEDVRNLAARMAHNQAQEVNEYRATAQRLGYDTTIDAVAVPPGPER